MDIPVQVLAKQQQQDVCLGRGYSLHTKYAITSWRYWYLYFFISRILDLGSFYFNLLVHLTSEAPLFGSNYDLLPFVTKL